MDASPCGVDMAEGQSRPGVKLLQKRYEMRTRDMSNLEVVKGLLDSAAMQIDMHDRGLLTTNETLLSLIEIIEKAVDVHADGGTCKSGEIDKNTGLLIRQGEGWINDDEETGKMDEETGKWVVLNFFPHSPTYVYGFFDDKEQAHAYAQTNGMTKNGNAYDVHMVHNAHYQEDASDYAGMGWVGRDGRA